jgi:hypothetical protein
MAKKKPAKKKKFVEPQLVKHGKLSTVFTDPD